MPTFQRKRARRRVIASLLLASFPLACGFLSAARGQPARGPGGAAAAGGYDDHQNMMDQLGIKTLRPGKNGNAQTGKGFTEELANDWMPTLPDVLKMKDGTKVTTKEQWTARRAEVLEDFEREIYGRIPKEIPKITWEVSNPVPGTIAGIAIITRTITGHVDNAAYPQITVNLRASFTIPANTPGPIPVLLEFGGVPGAGRGGGGGFGGGGGGVPGTPGGPNPGSWQQQAIQHGWAYGFFDPGSVQADAGGNALRQGIIGLCNKGQPRKPEDWGALRAWQWGVSQLINYFEANPDARIDPKKVGVEGVSRYGKAALVAEALEPRVAVAFVASSGEGGAKLHRHDMGEAVENLTGGEYYWMAGNFMKYGASDIKGKSLNASDLPVDSHELIALCAPRPCLISSGIPTPRIGGGIGDPLWIDAHGCYMAGVLATPVYELYGEKGFGKPALFYSDPAKFYVDPMPPLSTLVGGELAWRQHEGGHSAGPNFPTFFEWIARYISSPAAPATAPAAQK